MPLTDAHVQACRLSRPEAVQDLTVIDAHDGAVRNVTMICIYMCDHPTRQGHLAEFRKAGLPGVPCQANVHGCTLWSPTPQGHELEGPA